MDSTSKNFIIGIGNPIIDISASTDEESIKKYGLSFGGTVFANSDNVGFYDTLEKQSDVVYIPGGSVTNSIRVTNWMLNNSNSHGCMLLGSIGKDEYGDKIQSALSKVGVRPVLDTINDALTSRCAVGIHKSERCLMPEIRASTKLSPEFVSQNIDTITSANLLFIEGYFVIERYDIILDLSKKFHELGKKVAFTLSADFMVQNFYDRMLEVSNQSHIVFCNSDEARIFSGLKSDNLEEVATAIHKKLSELDRTLVITDGAGPVLISKYNYTQQCLDYVLKSNVYPIQSSEIVDTNGCGDSWVGGFLSQYMQGSSIEKCARAGNWASSVIIRNVGCTYPDNMEIIKF